MTHSTLSHRLVAALIRCRWLMAIVAVIAVAVAWPLADRLTLDRSLESMFRPEDPTLQAYQELKTTFGGNEVAMIVYHDPQAFSSAGIARNGELSDRVAAIDGVAGVLSPSVLNQAIETFRPLAAASDLPALANPEDAFAGQFDELFAGYTHTEDHQYAAIVAMLAPESDSATIEALREIVVAIRSTGDEAALVGEPVLLHDGFSLIERDGERLAMWTIALLSIVLLVSLRDWRFVVLSAAVILWTVQVTRATAVLLSIQLSIVSSILTAIVTVIAVASVLHLGVRYRTAKRRGATSVDATRVTLASLLVPIFWTCATDAAGFAALLFSRIRPVQDFGVMIAIASVAVMVALVLLTPALLAVGGSRSPRLRRRSVWGRRIRIACVRLASWFIAWRKTASAVALLLFVVLLAGVARLETETSFLNNFRPQSEIAQAYELVEHELGGAGVWDVMLPIPDSLSQDDLDRVRELEERLREVEVDDARLTKVLSIADVEVILGELPLLGFASPEVRLSGMRLAMPVISDALITSADASTPRSLRIMLRSVEQLPAETKNELIAEVRDVVQRHVAERGISPAADAQVTGYYVLIATWIRQLVDDQWRCLIASGILVWLLLVVATRSFRLATAALLPNLLPVFVVLAVVGLLGEKINMGGAMIAAVSVGLSIDSSVHFLTGYQRRRQRGHDATLAAAHAAGAISFPVISATIALVIGFSVLGTSEFVPTATFGILIAATLSIGTLINLTLLPALVRLVEKVSGNFSSLDR